VAAARSARTVGAGGGCCGAVSGPGGRLGAAWAQRAEVTGAAVPPARAAGVNLPGLVIDVDASIVVCHSEKEQAAATFKASFGYHPILAFLDNSGEFLAGLPRPCTDVFAGGGAGGARTHDRRIMRGPRNAGTAVYLRFYWQRTVQKWPWRAPPAPVRIEIDVERTLRGVEAADAR
jgi:hypothetical protein